MPEKFTADFTHNRRGAQNPSFGGKSETGIESDALALLSMIHTESEHLLYTFLLRETRRKSTIYGVFSNRHLLKSGITNRSGVRRACRGLVSKQSIERKRCVTESGSRHLYYFAVYDPADVIDRRKDSGKEPLHPLLKAPAFNSVSFAGTLSKIAELRLKYGLSRRETEVLGLCSRGLTNAEIGEKLYIQVETVKFHMRNIFIKMKLKKRTELIATVLLTGEQ